MKLEALETAAPAHSPDLPPTTWTTALHFRREVFGIDDGEASAQSWLTWTIDSYRELAGLGQPPYADYAVERRRDGRFVGSVGIVPTVVPWGALRGEPADALLSPEIGLFWGITARLPPARLRERSRRRPARLPVCRIAGAASGRDHRARQHRFAARDAESSDMTLLRKPVHRTDAGAKSSD